MEIRCSVCNALKDEQYFKWYSHTLNQRRTVCNDCAGKQPKNANRKRYKATPRGRSLWMRYQFKITLEQFDALLATQNNACAICKSITPGGGGVWHIDHNHACCPRRSCCGKCIRGLLCAKCNIGLGHFNDNPDLLKAAAEYVYSK